MERPDSFPEKLITKDQVVERMKAVIAEGGKGSDEALELLGEWLKQERARAPKTLEGEVAVRRNYAHIFALVGIPSHARDLLIELKASIEKLRSSEKSQSLTRAIDMDMRDIEAMKGIQKDIELIESGVKKVFMSPELQDE